MLITSKSNENISYKDKVKELINSLTLQPLIILIRITKEELDQGKLNDTSSLISALCLEGVKNIEIGWSNHISWGKLSKSIIMDNKNISFGAASITNHVALSEIKQLGFSYAMSPFCDESMIRESRHLNHLLIPGVFSPSEIQKAIQLKCEILKIFPASTLGINYLNQIKIPFGSLPFIIAAGGLKPVDLDSWLDAGYNAITIGRGLNNKSNNIDNALKNWLNKDLTNKI